MRTERLDRRQFFHKSVETALVVGTTPLLQMVIHFENTRRVGQALADKTVACDPPSPERVSPYPYDAIVVPAAGFMRSKDGTSIPNSWEQIRLAAAALAYKRADAPKIILVGETIQPGEDPLADTKYLQTVWQGITDLGTLLPDDAILREDISVNTATNMQELAILGRKNNMKKFEMITNSFHLNRATLFACNNGLEVSPVSAEELLLQQYPELIADIAALYATNEMHHTPLKEKLETILIAVDPKGAIPTLLHKLKE